MWIRKVRNKFTNFGKYHTCLNFLWKSDDVPIYIMDNHLAAAWCWMQECDTNEAYNFIHIDKHSDLKGCGHITRIEYLKTKPNISFEEYEKISYITNDKYQFFQWDNYIRACHYLFPNWFNTNLFYTQDNNECVANDWGYMAFPSQTMETLYVRQGIKQYVEKQDFFFKGAIFKKNMRTKKWIVNIDLDFFWDFNRTKVFDDQFIKDLGQTIGEAMNNIQVLTLALSPSCCGGWENAIECSKIFLSCSILNELCKEYYEEKKLFNLGSGY